MTGLLLTVALAALAVVCVIVPYEMDRARRMRIMVELFGLDQLRGMTMREAWLAYQFGHIHMIVSDDEALSIMEDL